MHDRQRSTCSRALLTLQLAASVQRELGGGRPQTPTDLLEGSTLSLLPRFNPTSCSLAVAFNPRLQSGSAPCPALTSRAPLPGGEQHGREPAQAAPAVPEVRHGPERGRELVGVPVGAAGEPRAAQPRRGAHALQRRRHAGPGRGALRGVHRHRRQSVGAAQQAPQHRRLLPTGGRPREPERRVCGVAAERRGESRAGAQGERGVGGEHAEREVDGVGGLVEGDAWRGPQARTL
eukprot:3374268-Rhodomonas_salina.1